MKTLKLFILLVGLFTLIHADLNAQIAGPATAAPPKVTMTFLISDDYDDAVAHMTAALGTAEILLTLTCNVPTELAVAVYNMPRVIGDAPQNIYLSGVIDTAFTTRVSFDGSFGDQTYVECGYIDVNGNYIPDSGCTVVIRPK